MLPSLWRFVPLFGKVDKQTARPTFGPVWGDLAKQPSIMLAGSAVQTKMEGNPGVAGRVEMCAG